MTRAFEIRPQLFVLSFCQFSRDSLSTLGIEENHILAVDLFALLWCRIRAGNVEIPVLHESRNMYSRRLLFADLQTARCSPSLKHRARHSMGIWLRPARRTLQNPGQPEAATHDNPAIGRRAQAKPARQTLQDTFWRRRSVHGTCAISPPIRPLRGANAGFCGQACSSMWQRSHSRPVCSSWRTLAIIENKSLDRI